MAKIDTHDDILFSPLDKRKVVSIRELAELLDDDPETIRRHIIQGLIPGGFQTGGKWKIRRSIVEAWWQKQGK
jgi:excisionase family DNA binding protein